MQQNPRLGQILFAWSVTSGEKSQSREKVWKGGRSWWWGQWGRKRGGSEIKEIKERRYQEVQSQMWKESERLFEPCENIQCIIQLYKRGWKQMRVWLQKKLMVPFRSAGPDMSSLKSRVPLAPKKKELQIRLKSLFGEISLPGQWLCSPQCKISPGSTRNYTSLQGRPPPSVWLQNFSDCYRKKNFFSSQAENQQVSLFLTSKFCEVIWEVQSLQCCFLRQGI